MTSKRPSNDALKNRLSRLNEITITVTGRKSGRTISVPVWFALEDGKLYLLPVSGSDTQWYKNVLKNPSLRIDAGGDAAELKAVPVTNPKQVASVVEKFHAKYGASDVKKYYTKFDVAILADMQELDILQAQLASPQNQRAESHDFFVCCFVWRCGRLGLRYRGKPAVLRQVAGDEVRGERFGTGENPHLIAFANRRRLVQRTRRLVWLRDKLWPRTGTAGRLGLGERGPSCAHVRYHRCQSAGVWMLRIRERHQQRP